MVPFSSIVSEDALVCFTYVYRMAEFPPHASHSLSWLSGNYLPNLPDGVSDTKSVDTANPVDIMRG